MKKLLIPLLVILATVASLAQDLPNGSEKNFQNDDGITYKLFPTQNIWTFIKLNTRNGLMRQVQYSMKEDNRFESYLNFLPLVNKDEERINRFTLYPTQNIYNFLLLDQLDGRVWQVQWSAVPKDRVVIQIK